VKTPYELLIERKPNISYFWVFSCKCFIFKKWKHLGKFESRLDVGMLVGYASNSKAYRVFNNSTRVIEETCVEFDESNGPQGDGFCCDDVGKEPLREAMKKMAIGDIKPKEDDDSHSIHEDSSDDDEHEHPRRVISSPTRQDSPYSSKEPPPTSQDTQDQVEGLGEVQSQDDPTSTTFGRHTRTSKNHPIDLVLDPKGGTRTHRKQYASFCKHHAFVSFVEPTTIDEALRDLDWILAMEDELNNFTRNEVWELVECPKNKNMISTKWVYRYKQDEHGIVVKNKARLVAKLKVTLKLKAWTMQRLSL
jgi:hypothetical protein